MRPALSLGLVLCIQCLGFASLRLEAGGPYQRLAAFGTPGSPGQRPYVGLAVSSDATLYGTTFQGGTNSAGTVFKLNVDGSGYSLLHQFSTNNLDGQSPGAVLLASDGWLYGTTAIGGTNKGGTVYQVNRDGSNYRVLHRFGTVAGDGQNPQAGLVEGQDGLLYGTTFFGGTGDLGTVFALSKDGTQYRVVRSFTGADGDGGNPDAAVVQAKDGVLYGTTFFGGREDAGTIFTVRTDGSDYAVLHQFSRHGGDGNNPDAALIQARDGVLFGTTSAGGNVGGGTVFKLETNGSGYTVLHHFGSPTGDGQKPLSALVEGVDGAMNGTTYLGGGNGAGCIFRVNLDGSGYSLVRSFSGVGGDGQNSRSTLARGTDGALYGTTWSGGDLGLGTVFRVQSVVMPQMIGVTRADTAVQVQFAGVGGLQYQVLRSTDLAQWSVMDTLTMPAAGVATNMDSMPLGQGAFYRAAWIAK